MLGNIMEEDIGQHQRGEDENRSMIVVMAKSW